MCNDPLHSVYGMAAPQLVWLELEAGYSSSFRTNIFNCMKCEISLDAQARKNKNIRIVGDSVLSNSLSDRELFQFARRPGPIIEDIND